MRTISKTLMIIGIMGAFVSCKSSFDATETMELRDNREAVYQEIISNPAQLNEFMELALQDDGARMTIMKNHIQMMESAEMKGMMQSNPDMKEMMRSHMQKMMEENPEMREKMHSLMMEKMMNNPDGRKMLMKKMDDHMEMKKEMMGMVMEKLMSNPEMKEKMMKKMMENPEMMEQMKSKMKEKNSDSGK